ncbi:ubiquinol-cytochrome c reductase subunit 9 [[Emmonsia] crescens]|uniref:Complex III subunit 9 n=1 Tax=[Emmonsia] crescens TaxID=73230 RepID=A0A2B7ZAD3_9EURO|nr:ubiquinol-cytochrome c reductase subunit 9 [Emmonsia crescens]
MAGISGMIYKQALPLPAYLHPSLFRRNTAFLTSMFVGAFAFEMAFDSVSDRIFDSLNRGRQWKDIRHQYIQKAEEEE